MRSKKTRHLGFTLIELIIAMAIAAILARVAFAAYTESLNRTKRTMAQTAIISASQAMERYFTKNNTYAGATITSPSAATDVYPSAVPATGAQFYTLGLSNQTATTYTITATRLATGAMKNDKCGDFTYTQTGTKGITNNTAGVAVTDCWR